MNKSEFNALWNKVDVNKEVKLKDFLKELSMKAQRNQLQDVLNFPISMEDFRRLDKRI